MEETEQSWVVGPRVHHWGQDFSFPGFLKKSLTFVAWVVQEIALSQPTRFMWNWAVNVTIR